jgi:hypothetical protein
MALDTFIAGRYSQTYNAVDTGITEEGYTLSQDSAAHLINNTDAYGDSIIDWVYRGGNVTLQFESKAYKAGSMTPFWPWGAMGVMSTAAAPIGRLASDVASAMVLTSTAATPAVTSPATLTASKSILAPNSPANLLFNSKVRNVPIRLQLLPYLSSSTYIWFATT